MKEKDQKKVIPPLAIDSDFFHLAIADPCTILYDVKLNAQSELFALLRKCLIAIYCTRWHSNFVEASQDGG